MPAIIEIKSKKKIKHTAIAIKKPNIEANKVLKKFIYNILQIK
ncbi:hypothetical protein HMPREF9075_00749 [Capnocytophaga sp. oral taxon 332 str. F0381]|nr:hypothetical protein HMPREF9075_00749 [Capnocytophaga sp. oral taxon 332 str. F0381]